MQRKEFRRKTALLANFSVRRPPIAGSIPVDAPFSPPYSRATRADTDGGAGFSSAKRWR